MSNKVEFTEEEKKNIPPEILQALDEGTAVAVMVPKPALSGRLFAIAAALTLGLALTPLFTPVTTAMAVSNGLMAFGWLCAFALMDRIKQKTELQYRIASNVSGGLLTLLNMAKKDSQPAESKEDLDGTSDDK